MPPLPPWPAPDAPAAAPAPTTRAPAAPPRRPAPPPSRAPPPPPPRRRGPAPAATPSPPAIHAAPLRLVHSPPSAGGPASRSRSLSSSSGFRIVPLGPLGPRRAPSAPR